GRKILPRRHQLPGVPDLPGHKNRPFTGLFRVAWGLLINRRGRLAASSGTCRSLAMLFALGAAATALDAISSLTSSSASSSSASSPQSTGFSAVDPFQIASPVTASTSSAPASGFSAGSQVSPATLNTL